MNKRVGEEAPDLAAYQTAALSNCNQAKIEPATECDKNGGENRGRDVHANQHRRHIDRIAAHPRNRPIIIGGSDSEHAFN